MSHMDDFDMGIAIIGPAGLFGLIIIIAICIFAASADNEDKKVCQEHGETYVDSRDRYILCKNDAGVVVDRK